MIFDFARKKRFLEKLFYALPPFDKFVSKADIREMDEVVGSRRSQLEHVSNLIKNKNHSLIIPIISEVGAGKTHFLWGIKNDFNISNFTTFISLPRSESKFYYYIYSDFVEEFGSVNLRDFTQEFGKRFGAGEKLYGIFPTYNTSKVISNAVNVLQNDYQNKSALAQCTNVIIQHLINRENFQITEQWLLAGLMDKDSLYKIRVNNDISDDGIAETMLKLITENYPPGILYLFDDFDKASKEYSSVEDFEEEEINWANDLPLEEEPIDGNDNGEELIDKIVFLLKSINNFKIIVSMEEKDSSKYIEILKGKLSESPEYLSEPIILNRININDTFILYLSRIEDFCDENNLEHPAMDIGINGLKSDNLHDIYDQYGDDLYFPLTKKIIEKIFEISNGNVRSILRNFKKIFDALIFEEITLEDISEKYINFISP